MSKRGALSVVAVLGLFLAGGLLLKAAEPAGDAAAKRFLGHISTDKPIYRAGERVMVRTVVLDADSHAPVDVQNAYAMVKVTGPKGETLDTGWAMIQDGAMGYGWVVPDGAAGGQYKIRAEFPNQGYPAAERKFEVRAYRVPRLKGEIVFLRDGFGPGDVVKASLHVERAEGGLPIGAAVQASAIVDGASVYEGATKIDGAGNCSVELKLPEAIEKGDGTLSLAITDGGVVEPISKTIPILVKKVDVAFYPEGGELVAGLQNRVYLEARTPSKKPADIVGQIVDERGQVMADVTTEHEGRGRFWLSPRVGSTYSLRISQPAGITKLIPLPEVRSEGVVLSSVSDVVEGGRMVGLRLAATKSGPYSVELTKHGGKLASHLVDLESGKAAEISLSVPGAADGVLTATVRDAGGKALAERLIFRRPQRGVHVAVTADKYSYVPGDAVTLTIATTDDGGKPLAATVGVTVTDAGIAAMLEQRDRQPRLREMALLESDVSELADAQVYLDPGNPKSNQAVDLLLGTQGWRRFAREDEAKFLKGFGDAGLRAMAKMEVPRPILTSGGFGGGGARGGGFFVGGMAMAQRDVADAAGVFNGEIEAVSANAAVAAPEGASIPQENKQMFQADFQLDDRKLAEAKMMFRQQRMTDLRVYAHDLRPDYSPGQRQDFSETLYWTAGIKTGEADGKATVSFKLNDSVASFTASADAVDAGGALGEGMATIHSVEPFYVEQKLPLEVSTGDVIQLPISAVNGTSSEMQVRLGLSAESSLGIERIPAFSLPAGGRDRRVAQIVVGAMPGKASLRLNAEAGAYHDQVTRELAIRPLGFPTEIAAGGMIDPNSKISQTVEIPKSVVAGSLVAKIALYPTPIGNLTEALQRLIQEPNGCFEQTSSTNYPLVMADQYFLSHSGVSPDLIARSNEMLEKGYQRLVGFECKNKGYEWFGEDPGHECLSAYAVLEFTDMSAVRTVDPAMLKETRDWLLARRDGAGGYSHERRALHTWIADPDCANGYCTWALLEAGQKGLEKEVAWLKTAAAKDGNSYVKALAANALFLAGDKDGAKQLMDEMARRQQADGHVAGATTTVVGSEGESLEIETTSLAALAWLRDKAYAGNVVKAIQFLANSCQGGRYGSTQSTVLALRAIVDYDRSNAHPKAAGSAVLTIDGKALGTPVAFGSDSQGVIMMPDFSAELTPGKHEIQLNMTDGSQLPYAMDVAFNSVTPASSELCKVGISVALKDAKLDEGAQTEADVVVTNKTSAAVPTPIAIVGLPGGLEVRYDQLKELVKAQRIAAYEVRGREVILYWRDFLPNQRVEIPLSLIAAVPGDYAGPASRAYLYYADENKQWVDGVKVSIAAK